MLRTIGVSTVEELFADIPSSLVLETPLRLDRALTELELSGRFRALAQKNSSFCSSFLGAGCYNHFIPATVDAVIGRSEFYTSYTPYQPEVSQGNLQAIFEYQTMICELTGMHTVNASLYDGATALAEAALMCVRITGNTEVVLSAGIHPQYREVVRTYCRAAGIGVREARLDNGLTSKTSVEELVSGKTACVLVQSPNFFGLIENLQELAGLAHGSNTLCVACVVEPTSLGLLKPPGEFNVDITAAEGQSLGNPQSFGGPHLGIIGCKEEYIRRLPGRLVGMTKDTKGRRGFVLTLQAREQHIRRQGATSNICSNQALCALAAAVYLATVGFKGLRQVALLSTSRAAYLYKGLLSLPGFSQVFDAPFYNEFAVRCADSDAVLRKLEQAGILGGTRLMEYYPDLENCLLLCATECNSKQDIDYLLEVLA
jgi:glycine dehydrogenase subunit 1